mmetsp:Transcript_24422/g.70333  ORF Transcript_24422/g.70333 Transcript_24422/m.70333 type:complete len:237 (+) Transcript_24422:5117-5827(+)
MQNLLISLGCAPQRGIVMQGATAFLGARGNTRAGIVRFVEAVKQAVGRIGRGRWHPKLIVRSGTHILRRKVGELHQHIQAELIIILRRLVPSEPIKLVVKVRSGVPGKTGVKIFLLVGLGPIVIAELRRTQERFSEHPPDIILGIFRIHHEGALFLVNEVVEVGWELKFGNIDAQGRAHLAAEPLDGDNVHVGNADAKPHTVLDGFGRDAELNPSHGLGLEAQSAPREAIHLEHWN